MEFIQDVGYEALAQSAISTVVEDIRGLSKRRPNKRKIADAEEAISWLLNECGGYLGYFGLSADAVVEKLTEEGVFVPAIKLVFKEKMARFANDEAIANSWRVADKKYMTARENAKKHVLWMYSREGAVYLKIMGMSPEEAISRYKKMSEDKAGRVTA